MRTRARQTRPTVDPADNHFLMGKWVAQAMTRVTPAVDAAPHQPKAKKFDGFTLPEILVALGIVGILSAIAIPLTLAQQARAADVTVRSDLTSVSAAIESALLTWRGQPAETLLICHKQVNFPTAGDFPVETAEAECNESQWAAKTMTTWEDPVPPLGGSLSDGVRLVGRISTTGEYCIMATSVRVGAGVFHMDSASAQIEPGTCFEAGWSDTSGSGGDITLIADPALPAAPSDLDVTVAENVATVSWTALANTTYAVSITGQPVQYLEATTPGTVTCVFPADTCAGPAISALPMGNYTAIVRAQAASGWGTGASMDFAILTASGLPSAPRDLVATPGDTVVDLTWLAPQSNLDGQPLSAYYIFRATDSTGPWTQVATLGPGVLSHAVTGLTNGTPYWFRVVGANALGNGLPAVTADPVTPGSAQQPPSVPTVVSASYVNNVGGRISVTWNAPTNTGSDTLTGYTVTAFTGSTPAATVNVGGDVTTANFTPTDGIALSTTYTFVVTATSAAGTSDPSDPSSPLTTPNGTVQTQTFTTSGSFTGQSGVAYDLLVVGGGGAGGKDLGGGGGGGQVAYFGGVALVGSQAVVIGNGGTAVTGTDGNWIGTNGEASSIGNYVAAGGGRGGSTCLPDNYNQYPDSKCSINTNAVPGGGAGISNGGGANGYGWNGEATAGTTPGTGNGSLAGGGSGFTGGAWSGSNQPGGGGAGAGGNASGNAPGQGRLITAGLFSGNTTKYGGGGGGGSETGSNTAGLDGGGYGAGVNGSDGGNASPNTGGGGGGGSKRHLTKGGNGGSGIVIVKWMGWP